MRTPQGNIEELERQIGARPAYVNSDNRGLVQNWLVAKGVPSVTVKRMKLNTLAKAYNHSRYLERVLENPYQPHPHENGPTPEPFPAREEMQPETPREETEDMEPMTAPNGHDKSAAAQKLAEALALLAPDAKLDEERVITLIREHAPKPTVVTVEIIRDGAKIELPEEPHHKQFAQVLRAVQCGNVFLRGPAGAGKTTLAEQVAKVLNVPFYFTGAVASEYKLLGFIDAQGRVVRTPFREAYEHGGLFLFDEIDASAPAALLAFNAALSNGHMDFPDGVIKRHPDFKCIAAGNTFGQGADRVYVGRNQLDAATLDRYIFIDFEYDADLERALAGENDWTSYVQSVRVACDKLKLRHVVSPRASIMGNALLAAGETRTQVERSLLWRGLDAETVSKIKSNIL